MSELRKELDKAYTKTVWLNKYNIEDTLDEIIDLFINVIPKKIEEPYRNEHNKGYQDGVNETVDNILNILKEAKS